MNKSECGCGPTGANKELDNFNVLGNNISTSVNKKKKKGRSKQKKGVKQSVEKNNTNNSKNA